MSSRLCSVFADVSIRLGDLVGLVALEGVCAHLLLTPSILYTPTVLVCAARRALWAPSPLSNPLAAPLFLPCPFLQGFGYLHRG